MLLSVDKANVRHWVDEILEVFNHASAGRMPPKLFRMFELMENFDGLADLDFAIRTAVWRIAKFANTGVPGAGIVPAIRCFFAESFSHFVKLNTQLWIQFLKHRAECGRHDAAADQYDVGIFDVVGTFHNINTLLYYLQIIENWIFASAQTT